jgi:NAD(P)H-dependent flavin oxidoreductase YrpB (nitropropane dioxygenase family)
MNTESGENLWIYLICERIQRWCSFPKIIQGGMGVGVSNWRLAQAVSKLGQLGVVSGTALDSAVCAPPRRWRRGRHMRRGLDAFPFPEMAKRIWQEYFTPAASPAKAPYPNRAHAPAEQTRASWSSCAW